MMRRPAALDLFCGAGGAARGLQRAGFFVVGVDVRLQPRYAGDLFIQGDALRPPVRLDDFDFVWASPPCQAYSLAASVGRRKRSYPDLVGATRELLSPHLCTCIENVPGAPIRCDLALDGTMFPERPQLRVVRRRHFELSFPVRFRLGFDPAGTLARGWCSPVGNGTQSWMFRRGMRRTHDQDRRAMEIGWMNRRGLTQAVPPAYSEFIGLAAIAQLGARAA